MHLLDCLAASDIHLGLRAAGKTALIDRLAALAAARTGLAAGSISAAVAAREALGSTGFGHGVALPHARLPGLSAPVVLLARLVAPIPFDAVDEAPVDLVALVLLPGEGAPNGSPLGAVAHALRDKRIAAALRAAPTAAAARAALAGDPALDKGAATP